MELLSRSIERRKDQYSRSQEKRRQKKRQLGLEPLGDLWVNKETKLSLDRLKLKLKCKNRGEVIDFIANVMDNQDLVDDRELLIRFCENTQHYQEPLRTFLIKKLSKLEE